MKVSLFLVVLAAVAVGYVTCGSGCKKTRIVLTYNTGLTPLVSGYEARRGAVVKAIETQAKQADFMCLQELWFEDDMKSVLDKVGKHFLITILPFTAVWVICEHRKKWSFRSRFAAPCSRWSLMSVGMCIQSLCASSDFSPKCITEKCEGRVFSMSQDFRSCAAIASGSALDIMSKCANAFNGYNRVNRPAELVDSFRTKEKSEQKKASPVVADKSKASPALDSKLPENYKLLTKYQNDYLQNDGRCTFCASENSLLQGKKENGVPDHVLVSGLETDVTSAKRVFDVDIKLSDHFGIQQDICLP